MVSISTTNNGIALAALRRVNADLNTTQNRIATGYRVNSAKDDAGVWATATKIRSDAAAAETVKSNINVAKAQVDAASAALEEIGSLVDQVATITAAVAAAGGTSTQAQADQVNGIKTQITALIGGATIAGKNLLTVASANDLAVKTGVADGALVGEVAYTAASPTASGTSMAELVAATTTTLLDALTTADVATAQGEIAAMASQLGAISKGFDAALNFNDKMADIRNNALGGLVDADLERESAKMSALQVRQQLAYQGLSMANNSSQNILMLFR